jgi:hypothetical protein
MSPTLTTKTTPATSVTKQPRQVEELREAVQSELLHRKVIQDFVKSQLKENVDYGRISINGREAKPTLFKPGMEKIFSLFQITSQLKKDEETLSMISTQNVIAYKCELYRNDAFIGEGRGACAISEKSRVNDAIKIAEKRARMDACLNLGFSEYFTQDLEDLAEEPEVSPPQKTPETPTRFPKSNEVLSFRVEGKEELVSRTGSPYARLTTNKGTVIAFKNTMAQFKPHNDYIAPGVWETRDGSNAFIITASSSQVHEQTPSNKDALVM